MSILRCEHGETYDKICLECLKSVKVVSKERAKQIDESIGLYSLPIIRVSKEMYDALQADSQKSGLIVQELVRIALTNYYGVEAKAELKLKFDDGWNEPR